MTQRPLQFSSPRRFLGITHSFKVTRKRLTCLNNAFPAINFFKIFWGRAPRPLANGLRAFGARGRPAPPAAAPRTLTQSCRKSILVRRGCGIVFRPPRFSKFLDLPLIWLPERSFQSWTTSWSTLFLYRINFTWRLYRFFHWDLAMLIQ